LAEFLDVSKELSNFAVMIAGRNIAALMVGGACLAACGVDTPDNPATYSEMVTFVATDSLQGRTIFELQESGDKPVQTLTAQWPAPSWLKRGQRMLATYTRDGDVIDLVALQLAQTDTLRLSASAAGSDTLWLESMWRTGSYINLNCKLPYTATAQSFSLTVDPATADDSIPQLRVNFQRPDTATVYPSYSRRTYASCLISELWSKPGCRGVKVRFVDTNTGLREITFNKQN
jgi:hypothetical protein